MRNAIFAIASTLFLVGAPSTAHALPSNCASIEDPAKRLKCFDAAQTFENRRSPNEKSAQTNAAETALKSLRNLRSTAQTNASLRDYGQAVMEQVPAIDEALRSITDSELRLQIERSKNSFIDARTLWSGMIQARSADIFISAYKRVYSKYEINPKFAELFEAGKFPNVLDVGPKYIIEPVWASADLALSKAEQAVAASK